LLEAVRVVPNEFTRYGTPYNRAALGFGQPNALGLFFVMTLPLVVWKVGRTPRRRWPWSLALGFVAIGLLATFSRGAWASAVLGSAALALAGQWRASARILRWVLVATVVLDLMSGGMVRDTFERTLGDWIIEQRVGLTYAGVLMFVDHPLAGVGPGGYEAQLDQYGVILSGLTDFQPTPHNAFVQMAAEAGIGGLVLYVALFVSFLRRAAGRVRAGSENADEAGLDRALLWSLGGLAISGFFLWPLSHGTGEVMALLFALIASAPRSVRPA
jgi:O-antigen ligase